jgi:hypothetical protein
MKKYSVVLWLWMVVLTNVNATLVNFDVYGVNEKIQKKINDCCKANMQEYSRINQQVFKSPNASEAELIALKRSEEAILKKINAIGDFSFLQMSTVYYPSDNNKAFTTIDIVEANEKFRLPKSPIRIGKKKWVKSKEISELYQLWNSYTQHNMQLMQTNKSKSKPCPVIHCTWGFDEKEKNLYLNKFSSGALKYKQQLEDIIKFSDNNSDREVAVFLLAHNTNYEEIANFLINYTDDSSEFVRNNAMRVLAAILGKHKLQNFPIEKIIAALNYPYTTDRNKAAFIIFNMVNNNKATHKMVKNDAGKVLIKLLKLQQPNNHDFAYRILKIISGKKFKDDDIKSWENWLNTKVT